MGFIYPYSTIYLSLNSLLFQALLPLLVITCNPKYLSEKLLPSTEREVARRSPCIVVAHGRLSTDWVFACDWCGTVSARVFPRNRRSVIIATVVRSKGLLASCKSTHISCHSPAQIASHDQRPDHSRIRTEVVRLILKSNLESGMNKLDSVDSDVLRETLAETTDPKAVKRLMVALAYDDGVSVDTLSERHGIPRSTIYSWLDRFEEDSIADAIRDEHRPGRPPLLSEQEREQLTQTLRSPPIKVGFSDDSWTPELIQEHIQQKYDTSYSLGHIRRLVR